MAMTEPTPPPVLFLLALTILGVIPSIGALNVTLNTTFSWQNTTAWALNFTVGGNASNCALYTNESGFSPVANTSSINASGNGFTRAFAEGNWLWTLACTDANGTVFAPTNGSVGVDLGMPNAPNVSIAEYNVSWSNQSSDALSGIVRFELYRNTTLILNTTNASVLHVLDYNATANATYAYRLDVVDQAGNRNSSNASFEPFSTLANLTVVQMAPRIFNVSWQTDVPTNESVAFTTSNGSTNTYANTSLKKQHSLNLTTPSFGTINGMVTSCSRRCLNQTFSQAVLPTINFTLAFYNATFNNQTAVFQLRWDSLYGLTYVALYSNNSGTDQSVFSAALPKPSFFTQNLTFQINDTATAVSWTALATDALGETLPLNPILFYFNPNVTQPQEPPSPNVTYAALHIGETFNASNGYGIRLLGLSNVPIGPSQFLTAVFESFAPDGQNESRFSMEENGRYNTSKLAVALYRVFVGLGNTSYAQVYAEPLPTPTPSPTPTPEVTPEPSVQSTPSPTPNATASNLTNANATQNVSTFSGIIQEAHAIMALFGGSALSGYVLASDGTNPMAFNATYAHNGSATSVFFLVRIRDGITNKTVGVARSTAKKASNGKTLSFSTDTINLAAGPYKADAIVATEDQNVVLDSRPLTFTVLQPGANEAVTLAGALAALALGVFLFILKISHHKKGMAP